MLSIIVPVFDAQTTLPRLLGSFQRITPPHRAQVELIFINDGSQDASLDILTVFAQSHRFPNVVVLDQPNAGSSAARNAGLVRANGPWVFFLDADDELACDPVPYIMQHPDATAIGFAVQIQKNTARRVTRRIPPIPPRRFFNALTAKNPFHIGSLVIKPSQIQTPFDEDTRYLEDWLFWARNPGIFERFIRLNHVISATIHVQPRSKSTQQQACGRCRTRIAETLLQQRHATLTRPQRNNLLLQAQIGRLQQGGTRRLEPFALCPCSPTLYAKHAAYWLLKSHTPQLAP